MEETLEKINLNHLDKSTWESFRFEEIAQKISKTVDPNSTTLETYVGLEHIDPDDIHIRRFGSPDDVSGGKLKCYPGDVIFGKRRAYQRKAAIADFEGICSAHAFVFRANPEVIDPKLFPFFLHSDQFMHRMVDISVGGLSPTINWGDLKHQEFLLPPKSEQARLAELLWAMDEVIEREREVLEKTINLKSSVRKELLEGPKDRPFEYLGSLKSSWGYTTLNNLASIKGRIGWRGLKQSEYVEEGPYLIAGKHINEGKINWDACDMITEERYLESMEIALRQGDVIFSKDGAIGNPAMLRNLPGKATLNSTMMLIRPNEKLDSEFLYQILLSAYFERLKYSCLSGSAIPHIFQGDMKNFQFPIPPVSEQESIGKRLHQIDLNIDLLKSKIFDSQSLQKSLINQIF